MAKLTKSLRETIASRLLARAFKDRVEAQIADEVAFFDVLYADIFKKDLPKLIDVPDYWLYTDNNVYVTFGSVTTRVYAKELAWTTPPLFRITLGKSIPDRQVVLPAKNAYSLHASYDAQSTMSKAYTAVQNAHDNLQAEIKTASVQAHAVLNSASSFKKLYELWPDIKDLVSDLDEEPIKAALPTVSLAALNTTFELPPETAAA